MSSSFENMSSAGQRTAVLRTHCFPSCQSWNRKIRYSFLKNRTPMNECPPSHTIHFRLGASEAMGFFEKKIQSTAITKKLRLGFSNLSVPSIELRHFSPTNWSSMMLIKLMTLHWDSPGYVVGWKIDTSREPLECHSEFRRKKKTKQTSQRPGRFDWNEWVISPGNHKQGSYPNRDQH